MEGKTAYVGSAKGELSVMVSRQDAIVAVDLLLPNVPPFTLRMNTADIVDKDGDIFYEMLGAVIMQTVEYLKSCNVPANLVEALHQELVKKATGISEDDHADRTGTGGSKLLEAVVALEPLNSYEVKFDMPEGLIQALHTHVVTAGQKGRQRSTLAAAHLARGVASPAFKAWFAGSKVVNPDGTPKVMYHGTASPDIVEFDGTGYSDRGAAGFFTENPAFAGEFADSREQEERERDADSDGDGVTYPHGPQIYPVYIRALNIFDARNPEHVKLVPRFVQHDVVDYSDLEASAYDIWDAGFDAYLDFERGIKSPPTGLAVKSPNQIKSAIGNSGAYDPNDNRITAAFHTIKRQKDPLPLAHNFQTNHDPSIVKQNRPALRDVIRKFKNQQNKRLTGPIFVLVYDMNGRPVGVRSIKGPGWQGIGGKIAARDVVEINGKDLPVFVNPSRTEMRGLQMNYMARGWLSGDGQTLVAWCGYDAIHNHVLHAYLQNFAWGQTKNRIPVEIWGNTVQVTDSSRNTVWHHNPYLKQLLMASPAVRRALGGPPKEINYYDEAIVGPWEELTPEAQHTMIASTPEQPKARLFRKEKRP